MWNYFKIGPEVQEEMPFKSISYLELWWSSVQRNRTTCVILIDGLMRNNIINLFLIWTSGSEGDDF